MKCESVAKHVAICDKCFNQMLEFFKTELARKAGKSTSVRKARASRKNGKLGGRPKKLR